jgi:hypothetical protein
MNCPNCKEPQAHRSHRNGLKDWFMGLFKQTPYRCKACKTRFYVYRQGEEDSRLRTPEEQRIIKLRRKYKWKQSKRQLLAFGIGAVLVVVAIYLIVQERVPPGD